MRGCKGVILLHVGTKVTDGIGLLVLQIEVTGDKKAHIFVITGLSHGYWCKNMNIDKTLMVTVLSIGSRHTCGEIEVIGASKSKCDIGTAAYNGTAELKDSDVMFLMLLNALFEINATNDLRDTLVVVVPNINEASYTKHTIHVEYEWDPRRCSKCLVYGHLLEECPKAHPKRVPNSSGANNGVSNDEFTTVKRKGFHKCLVYGHLLEECPKAHPKRVPNSSGANNGVSNDEFTTVKRKGFQ
ncbi:zinc knuckle CX2CX4HX4C [Artemisia annua]|uniref:Zinc knuckle CX2CX4HX4C n=1 Tax=Artemisia annua TaxID=35608 RepID=A0A2U1NMQ8_ARTAN|nr:zinc knuckle CX2CX4HX4C [Artemisia annua]